MNSFIAPALPQWASSFYAASQIERHKERNIWMQLLHLTWGSLVDAQWNPHHHCFQVSQQNRSVTPVSEEEELLSLPADGYQVAAYLAFQMLPSWSKEESQINGRKVKTIIPTSIFMLWKLKSWVTFLSKGWWHFPCQASLEKLDLTGKHQEKSLQEDTLLVFPLYLSFFAQRNIKVLACYTSILLACHLAV